MIETKSIQSGAIHQFIPLVQFLGAFFGENCEVVLHDVTQKEKSILAIANGENISGRKIGSPLTDLALKFLKEKEYQRRDWVMGYTTRSRDGSPLRSATYFIRDREGNLAGILCLNMNLSDLMKAKDSIDRMAGAFSGPCQDPAADGSLTENFSSTAEDLTMDIIGQAIAEKSLPPDRMTADEKIEMVRTLNQRGAFLLKGSVRMVARHLASSEPTIYRYLKKVRSGS